MRDQRNGFLGIVISDRVCDPSGGSLAKAMQKISYDGYRFPPVINQRAIWLYLRFTLSLRDVFIPISSSSRISPTALSTISARILIWRCGYPVRHPTNRRSGAKSAWFPGSCRLARLFAANRDAKGRSRSDGPPLPRLFKLCRRRPLDVTQHRIRRMRQLGCGR